MSAAYALADGISVACNAWAAGLRRPPQWQVSAWADKYRRLPSKGASEAGRWHTSRVPYSKEIMDVLSMDHPAKRVVLMKSAQVAGTEIGNNWVGWFIHTQRAPMLAVQPTLDMAERWSKQRIAPMIEDTPALRKIIAPARARDSGNTTLLKEFPGGLLVVAGANSAAGLRSMPAKYLFLDEVDAYPLELDEEGDPIKLAEARTTTFPRRKIFLVSTPTIESLSRIHKEYLASDQRHYHVPCPECGEYQILKWENLRWPDGEPKAALYHCEHCGVGFPDHHKTDMLARGQWRAEFPERDVVGFHVNALYTPIGLGLTWAELAQEWDDAKRDPARQKTFTNIRLGECYADPNEKLDFDELKSRAEPYKLRTIPRGCLLITAGVDVQKDRLAVQIIGHGRGGVVWVLDYVELPGDPTRDTVWAELDTLITTPMINSCGVPLRVTATAVDSGYLTDDVLHYTRPRKHRGVIAIKGAAQRNKPIITRPSKVDYNWRGSVIKKGAELWTIGSDTVKHHIFARLTGDRKHPTHERLVHFSEDLGEEYFVQLTAEVWDPNKRRWIKIRPRNEALDTLGYAIAAAMQPAIRVHTWQEHQWVKLEAALEPANDDLFAQPMTQADANQERATPTPTAPRVKKPRKRRVVSNPQRGYAQR